MPVAPVISASMSGERSARSAASRARLFDSGGGEADAHEGRLRVGHDRPDVREVEVDEPRHRDEVGNALDTLAEDVVGDLERVEHRRRFLEHLEQPVVRDDDRRVARGAEVGCALLRLAAALRPLELERRRDDADRERAELARDLCDDGRRAGAGAAALTGGDEDHVGAAEFLPELVVVLLRRPPADVGIRTGAEPLRELAADVDLDRRVAHLERLDVGVDGDELDLRDAGVDHPVHGVDARASDADDLDHGEVRAGVGGGRAVENGRRLGHRLEEAGRRRRLGHRSRRLGIRRRRAGHRIRRRRRRRRHLDRSLLLPARDVLDRSLLRLRGSDRIRRRRDDRVLDALLRGLSLRGRSALLRLLLRGLGRLEQFRQRTLTHARAPTRHREPPSLAGDT